MLTKTHLHVGRNEEWTAILLLLPVRLLGGRDVDNLVQTIFKYIKPKFDLYKSLDQPKKAANVQKLIDCSSFILGEDGRYSELLGFEYERLEDVVSNNCKKLDAYQNAVQILQITCRIPGAL